MKYVFPKDIIHQEDMSRYGDKEYNSFVQYYATKSRIIEKCNPSVIAEIGVRAGYSAYAFLSTCPNASYYGFDNNDGKESGAKDLRFYNHATKILSKYNVVQLHNDFNSQEAVQLPIPNGAFVHVDGDHSYEGALHDLELAKNSGAKWILVDDIYYIHSVFVAINAFLMKHNLYAKYYADFRGEILITL